jgi:hypothetical protein
MFLITNDLLEHSNTVLKIMISFISIDGNGIFITGTWKMNVNDTKRNFPSLESKLNFNHKIDANGKGISITILKAKCC